MGNLWQDLRFAVRMLGKSPGFTATTLLMLTLGIGANTAIFSMVNAVLYRSLPYKAADRLVVLWEQNLQRGWTENIVSAANFLDWKQQNDVFDDMAAFEPQLFTITGNGKAQEIEGEKVTANLFSLLQVQPLYGRLFSSQEAKPGTAAAVVSYGLWKEHYGGDPGLVGRQIVLDGESYAVLGILPANFSGEYAASALAPASRVWVSGLALQPGGRTSHEFDVIARLKPDVTLGRAQSEMDTITNRIQQQFPEDKGWSAAVVGLHAQMVEGTRPALLVLLGAVVLVLLIACANVANLSLVRATGREKEVAIRTAMGARRGLIVRQFLIESILLSVAGTAIGLVVAGLSTRVLEKLLPPGSQQIEATVVNGTVIVFAMAVAILIGLVLGLVPALAASKANLNDSLKESVRGSTKSSKAKRLRDGLVIAEFAFALALLVAAGLMIKTLANLGHVGLGFNPNNLLTMTTPLKGERYKDYGSQVQFFQQLVGRIEALPGVEMASVSRGLPMYGWDGMFFVTADNPAPPTGEIPDANYIVVGPHYFRTMEIPLLEGRSFTDSDTTTSPFVVVVNEELARRNWPGQDPIGKQLKMETGDPKTLWLSVVGVARNVRTEGQYADFRPEVYVPYTQYPLVLLPRNIIVRTASASAVIVPEIRRIVNDLDNDVPVSDVGTMTGIVAGPLAQGQTVKWLLEALAALALILASLGIYSVISYTVTQRIREIGIRMALGANRGNVITLFVREGLIVATVGVVVGLALAFSITRFLSSLLFAVRPTDPMIFTTVTAILSVIALTASFIPARRAAKVDPMVALRYE